MSQKRLTCEKCRRPEVTCYCHLLKPIENTIPVVIFQHERELAHPFGTAALIQQALKSCQSISVKDSQSILPKEFSRPLLLYPHEKSVPVSEVEPGSFEALIVLDGTWRKSYKMFQSSPWLKSLPACHLPENPSSRYSVRQSSRSDSYSTLEAAVDALRLLENGQVSYQSLLDTFEWLMQKQMQIKRQNQRTD